ncbi:MAG: hypothetical protein ACLFQK_11610, partial [Fibrobacterota bacterium]
MHKKITLTIIFLLLGVLAVNAADRGYITNYGTKYMWSGTGEAFIPNFVMLGTNDGIDLRTVTTTSINSFMDDMFDKNGFNGIHVPVYGQWFHAGTNSVSGASTNLDQVTFDKLKMIIQEAYARGGAVHIWAWGDAQRGWASSNLPGG